MSQTITGVVTNGVIVPSSPLPEGARVVIQVRNEFTVEEQEEFDAWQQGSAEALALVERLAEEEEQPNEKR
jgi:hypothetical protein